MVLEVKSSEIFFHDVQCQELLQNFASVRDGHPLTLIEMHVKRIGSQTGQHVQGHILICD